MNKKKRTKKAEAEVDKAFKAPRKEHKTRVTTFIDGDVLDELKKQAKNEGIPYQTLLNQYLRSSVLKEVPSSLLNRLLSSINDAG